MSAPAESILTVLRRRDREEDDRWVREMLHRAAIGTLATEVNGQPFLNLNIFVFDERRRSIYLHTARTGRTRSNLETPRPVCFGVMELGRMLPSKTALNMSCEYASVIAFGTGAVVQDRVECRAALGMLNAKYFPDLVAGVDYRDITEPELARTSVYRVSIEEWSGKRKKVEEGFEGARVLLSRSMLR